MDMIDPGTNDHLKVLFTRQRAAERRQAPSFRAMTASPREASPSAWPWAWAARMALALGLAVAAIWWGRPVAPQDRQDALVQQLEQTRAAIEVSLADRSALTAWQAPTDFLLNPTDTHTP